MSKELTQEEKDFRLDSWTLNRQLIHWLETSKCIVWNLRQANKEYDALREEYDHATAMPKLIRKMFEIGIKEEKYEPRVSVD